MELIKKNSEKLNLLCSVYNVDKLYLFGSILNSKFNKKSDIDFLVKFKEIALYTYFENYINFKNELKKLLGREVDLVEEQALRNPIFKKSINDSKELIYG